MSQSDAAPTGTGRKNPRGLEPLSDMVRSMIVLLVIVAGIGVFATVFYGRSAPPRPTVDYMTTAEQARTAAKFELLTPRSLPEGWRATTATFEPGEAGRWHLGILADEEEYVGLEQAKSSPSDMVDRYAAKSRAAGTAKIAGSTWQVRTQDKKHETTFVRDAGDVTTLVTGTVPRKELEDYVSSLTAD